MTSTKLPTDTELATPIGGKVVDPELEAKAIVKFMQEQLDEAADEFLDILKPYAEPIQFDTTEYD